MKRLYAATRRQAAHERCELCALPIGDTHDHLYAPASRSLKCACQACAMIVPTSTHNPYRAIPKGAWRVDVADVAAWLDRLNVPVGVMALVVREASEGLLPMLSYPGPAGLVEAELSADDWVALCAELPAAANLLPEVEALVWSRLGTQQVWRVGIDAVFRLVGELRQSWQGITGGLEGPAAVKRVLAELEASA